MIFRSLANDARVNTDRIIEEEEMKVKAVRD